MPAPLFFDGDRLVLPHVMMWVAEAPKSSSAQWAVFDSDGGCQLFRTKEAARDHLARYAEEG